jgi:hypothetical protein
LLASNGGIEDEPQVPEERMSGETWNVVPGYRVVIRYGLVPDESNYEIARLVVVDCVVVADVYGMPSAEHKRLR